MRRRRSACSIYSASSGVDIDLLAETELNKLQRQFRILEGERQAYGVESQDLIRRQLRHIQKLQSEREELLRSLRVSESPFRRCDDAHATCSLIGMLDYRDRVEEQLESEQKTVMYLKQEILNMERKLAGQRRGGSTTCLGEKSEPSQTQNTCRILENKLDRGLVRFNKLLAKNGQLREELKILHVERKQFQNLYSRMERELQENHKEMQGIMAQSTAAFEVRVESTSKRTMLKEKTVKDLALYGTEMSELERVVTLDLQLQTFLSAKAKERVSQNEGQDVSRRQVEEMQRRRRDSGEWGLDTFEEAFHKIHCVTGENDLDTLVGAFVKMEEKSLSLLNFVNEQNNEADMIKEQINKLKQEMESYATEEVKQQEEHHSLLRAISVQQQATEEQALAYHHRIQSVDKILDQLMTGIDSMFHNINCDRSVIEDKLGSSTGIRDATIMTYLGLVERKTNELLTLESFLNSKDNPGIAAQHILGQSPPVQTQNLTVEPPTLGDENDPEECLLVDQVKPLTKDQLLPWVSKRVLRKAKTVKVSKTITPWKPGSSLHL